MRGDAKVNADETDKTTSMAALISRYNQVRDPRARSTVCHAPSVNLNFDQSGNATACCYNRRYLLGTYPRQSVQEIWQGPRVKELRELLKAGDLSKGCQLCEHQLKAQNFVGLRASGYDRFGYTPSLKTKHKSHQQELMPKIIEFEISNACNLECIMCNGYFSSSIRRNREKLEPMKNPYDDAFVEQIRPFLPFLIQAKFLGGEPFLNPTYYKIWDMIIAVNSAIDASITTNATIMNDRVRRVLEKLRPTISVSCDSLDKKTYESIRVNAKYETFFENLMIFRDSARVSQKALALSVCPMQNNWKTIPDILRFCNESAACIGFNTMVWPLDLSIQTLPKPEITKVVKFLEAECSPDFKTDSRWWVRHNYGVYQSMLNQLKFWASDETKEVYV